MRPSQHGSRAICRSAAVHLRLPGWPKPKPTVTCIIAVMLTLASTKALPAPPPLPDGWRYATAPEAYEASSDSYVDTYVSGDFDGDNIPDHAAVVVTSDSARQELIVLLSSHDDGAQWQVLDSLPFIDSVSMGVARVPPGKLNVLCETNEECLSAEKKEIVITKDAINYFRPESANSLFIYKMGTFNRIWQSYLKGNFPAAGRSYSDNSRAISHEAGNSPFITFSCH